MARTKKTYSNGIAPAAPGAPAASARSWVPTKVRSSKCVLCSAEFEYMTTEEIEEHDLRCASEVAPLQEHEALQSTEKHDPAALEQVRESSSRLTTPPESPLVGLASLEGSVAGLASQDNDVRAATRLDGSERDVGEADGDGVQADENGDVVVKNDLFSFVSAYVGDELEFYEVEDVRTGEPRDLTESLTTPVPFSIGASESVDDIHDQEASRALPATKVKRFPFRKLTDMQKLEQYLANPEEMSYDMLYHKLAIMVNVLQDYSKEYRDTDREIQDSIALIKLAETEEKVPAKEQRRLDLEAKDAMHYRLYDLYYAKLKALAAKQPNLRNPPGTDESTKPVDANDDLDATEYVTKVQDDDTSGDDTETNAPLRGRMRVTAHRRYWQGLAEKLLEAYPQDSSMKKELAELMYGSTLEDMLRRKKEREMPVEPAEPPSPKISALNLINVPPPKLDRETLDLYATRQPSKNKPSLEQTLENWEMQKMAAVYGLPFVNGTVELRDRNGGQSREGRNGRPMRAVRQITKYDTEQSEAAGTSSEDLPRKRRRNEGQDNTAEELPTKRRRKEEPTVGSPAPVQRSRTGTATRQLPEQPKFPSGNTIGRPRGSKTKAKTAESKLKESHLPLQSPVPEERSSEAQHQSELEKAVNFLRDPNSWVHLPKGFLKSLNKKGKHGGARVKGVSTKNGGGPPIKPVPRGKRVKKKTTQKSALLDDDEKEVMPSTEMDDGSQFASAVSRPTTASSVDTAVSAETRRSTRQSTREKSKVADITGSKTGASNSTPSITPKKRKRTNTAQESIQVALPNEMEPTESAEVPDRKKRKTKAGANSKSQPTNSTGTFEGIPASLVKAGHRRKTAGTKGAENIPTKADKRLVVKIAVKEAVYHGKGMMVFPMLPVEAVTETEPEENSDSESESDVEEVKKPRKTAKAKPTRKRKRDVPDAETADDDLTEAELKAKKKSEKLSESAKKRWASGQMAGPMAKRQATVAAKKLLKKTEPIPPPSVTSAPHVPPPINTSAPSSGTRTSGRKRKPTSRALGGGDGADDSESDSVLPFKSEYEHFQALSSPGTPALPKRRSKQVYNLSAFVGSEEDDEDDFY